VSVDEAQRERRGLADLGPAWISAIAAAVAALVAVAGFFAGRVTAPGSVAIGRPPP
jgi:hypothetical protein